MRSEYKRDMNHNYLILHGEDELDTSAYQVRMLVGNVIPSLLKCRIQGMDGRFAIYYDITSRQSIAAFYEDKKLGEEDLKLIFGDFIRVMEDAAEYLMNPCQLVVMPEYMFLEVEKREIYFCFMPGYQKDVKEQFQALTEYILPKIDHEDERAVMIGYGVYKRALEECFHLEHIKEELYRVRECGQEKTAVKSKSFMENNEEQSMQMPETAGHENEEIFGAAGEDFFGKRDDFFRSTNFAEKESHRGKKKTGSPQKKEMLRMAAGFAVGILSFAGILTAKMLGYLPEIGVELILGVIFVCMGTGMFIYTLGKKIKKKKEERETKEGEDQEKIGRREEDQERKQGERWSSAQGFEKKIEFVKKPSLQVFPNMADSEETVHSCGETVVLSMNPASVPVSLVSREPGELATIYLEKDLTVIGKLKTASDAVVDLPTVSRVHAKIRKRDGEYYLSDLNSRNGTAVNGRILKAEEEYCLQNEDEVDFAQARYVFLK